MTAPVPIDVRLENVVKRFGDDVAAVDGISVEIPHGSFFALLGPSGCGKTTTLRMIGGFEEPTEGSIYLGDTDVVGLPPYKRDVNTVFQSYALFPHMTIFENVAFGLERRKVDKNEIRGRVLEMLELVDLKGRENGKPKQLSGGQQQRVALARALVNTPRVLLLDEPLGALDLKLRKQMQLELKRIQREVGITFVHVTHDQEEAMTMADTIAVMNRRQDRAARVADRAVRAAARRRSSPDFLGTSNLLDGTVEGPGAVRLDDGTTIAGDTRRRERDGRRRRPAGEGHGSAHGEPNRAPRDREGERVHRRRDPDRRRRPRSVTCPCSTRTARPGASSRPSGTQVTVQLAGRLRLRRRPTRRR